GAQRAKKPDFLEEHGAARAADSASRTTRTDNRVSAVTPGVSFGETPPLTNRTVYLRFLPYLRPYWRKVALTFLMLVSQVGMGVLEPWPLKFVFDSVIGNHHIH